MGSRPGRQHQAGPGDRFLIFIAPYPPAGCRIARANGTDAGPRTGGTPSRAMRGKAGNAGERTNMPAPTSAPSLSRLVGNVRRLELPLRWLPLSSRLVDNFSFSLFLFWAPIDWPRRSVCSQFCNRSWQTSQREQAKAGEAGEADKGGRKRFQLVKIGLFGYNNGAQLEA